MSEQNLDPELSSLADALAGLKPSPAALDRDALMFRAGRASAPRGWTWPLATAASALLALGLGAALFVRPQPQVVKEIEYVKVEVPAPAPAPSPQPKPPEPQPPTEAGPLVAQEEPRTPASSYRQLEEHLLRWGFDGLPQGAHSEPSPKETPDSLLHSL
jgi:hypothetical protein